MSSKIYFDEIANDWETIPHRFLLRKCARYARLQRRPACRRVRSRQMWARGSGFITEALLRTGSEGHRH